MAPVPGAPLHVCYLCRRKFQTLEQLERHERLSELHRQNLDKQDELVRGRKEELRSSIATLRQQMHEVNAAVGAQGLASEHHPGNAGLQSQRAALEMQVRQLLGEYGQAQEVLEQARGGRDESKRGAKPRPTHHEVRVGRLVITAEAATWQGGKDFQEDRHMTDIELEFQGRKIAGFCVMDGHVGSLCVDDLCDRLPANLQKCLSTKPALTEEHLAQAVAEACVLTDDEFLRRARQQEVLDGSCLILGIFFSEDPGRGSCRLLVANVGDSRAVLCRGSSDGDFSAVRLSDDHKPGRPDEKRRIEAKGGVVDLQGVWRVFTPGPTQFGGRTIGRWGLAVSRAFGDLLLKEPERYGCSSIEPGGLITAVPEIRVIDIQPSEDRFLVLACDGIWDVLSDDDAVAVCASQAGVGPASLALIKRSFAVGSEDNLTAVVVTWREETPGLPGINY